MQTVRQETLCSPVLATCSGKICQNIFYGSQYVRSIGGFWGETGNRTSPQSCWVELREHFPFSYFGGRPFQAAIFTGLEAVLLERISRISAAYQL